MATRTQDSSQDLHIMTVTMSLETRQRALSEWWSEETEYLFQRIERWAACARGYNRLRSKRLSRSRMTMEDSSSARWSISGNKLFVEEASWNPRFQTLSRSQASKSQPEELKLNCCGTLNYKSNGKLDSTCLESYSYDHSIYFKTIGDLKRKRNQEMGDKSSRNDNLEEKVEWEQPRKREERFNQLIFIESFGEEDVEEFSRTSAWPEVDLTKLSINHVDNSNNDLNQNHDQNSGENLDQKFEHNVNLMQDENHNLDFGDSFYNKEKSRDEDQKEVKRFFTSGRKFNKCRQVVGEDNIVWPGVLLTYRKNIDPLSSPHRYVESVGGSDCYFVPGM